MEPKSRFDVIGDIYIARTNSWQHDGTPHFVLRMPSCSFRTWLRHQPKARWDRVPELEQNDGFSLIVLPVSGGQVIKGVFIPVMTRNANVLEAVCKRLGSETKISTT